MTLNIGSLCFCFDFSQLANSNARRCRMGRKFLLEDRCRRAAIGVRLLDGNARVWLEELKTNVPDDETPS